MSPSLANFLFEAANFLVLAAALGWLLFKPVGGALDAERERHAGELEQAKRLHTEAETLAAQARATREEAAREAAARREEILAAAHAQAATLPDEASKAQRVQRLAFERELAGKRDADAAALAEAVGRLAAESVRRMLDAVEGPSLDAALVRAACARLEALPAQARTSALVESAHALDAEARGLLADVIGEGFQARVVSELGAGVRVTTAAGQVDATASSLARRAARAVREIGAEHTEATEHGDG